MAGAPLSGESAYRSYASQSASFARWVDRLGYQQALLGSASPGHSEHQLGTAIDFKSTGGRRAVEWRRLGPDRGGGLDGQARLGVRLRPELSQLDLRPLTCYGYEPWHYR